MKALCGVCLTVVLLAPSCARRTTATVPAAGATPASAPGAAVDPLTSLRQDLLAATRLPGVQRGLWGIAVHSLDRGDSLFELNSRALLVPASTAKIVSAATAADAVGWDYRFETTVRATGPVVQGVLRGDLVVTGSGDPSLGGRGGDDVTVLVDGITKLGIRRIEGRVIGDDDALEEPRPQLAWAWDDLGYPSGSLFGALNVNENRTAVMLTPAVVAGQPAAMTTEPLTAYRPLTNRVVTGPPGTLQLLWAEQRPGDVNLTVAGSIPAGAPPARLSVSGGNPTLWFANVLRNALVRAGVEVTGDAYDIDDVMPRPDMTAAPALYTYTSPPLSAIVKPMLKESINLYAEAALRLNATPGVFATNDAALEGLRKRLDAWGVPADGQQLIDGSGLSRRDVISPEALMIVLRRMFDAGRASPFMAALPVAGVDGSLETRMRGTRAQGNLQAKTGTMSNIRSLAGFVTAADGERLALVVIVNNFEGTGAAATQAIDSIAVRVASFTRSARGPQPASPPASR